MKKKSRRLRVKVQNQFLERLEQTAQQVRVSVAECNQIAAEFEQWQQAIADEMNCYFTDCPESWQKNPMRSRLTQVKTLMALAKRLGSRDTLRLLATLWGNDAVQAELDLLQADSEETL